MFKIIILCCTLFSTLVLAQGNGAGDNSQNRSSAKSQREQIHEQMQRQLELMRKMMDEAFGGQDQGLDKMFDQFHRDFFDDDFFQDPFFGPRSRDLFEKFEDMEFDYQRDYRWDENDNERILTFKFKPLKDTPIDIKVTKDTVTIKGKVKIERSNDELNNRLKSISIKEFHKTIPVPQDCEGSKAKIEQTKEGIRIRIPKIGKAQSRVKPKATRKPLEEKKKLIPVSPGPSDKTI